MHLPGMANHYSVFHYKYTECKCLYIKNVVTEKLINDLLLKQVVTFYEGKH